MYTVSQKKKKTKELKNDIAGIKKMIRTLRNTLEHQRTQLDAITANTASAGVQDNMSSESESDSESSSSD